MTIVVTHAKVSGKPAGGDPTRVYGTHWDANHAIAGTADASQLNANVVQAVVNDTNIQGSIANQTLTFSWGGTLAAARLNTNVVQAITNDTNVTGSITAQNLTLGWTGQLGVARGGTNADLSATGGASKVLKQTSVGAPVTVAQLAFTDISGTASASQLPNPTASTLGGIESYAAISHQWINTISTSGVPSSTQPAFTDISGSLPNSQLATMAAWTFKVNNTSGTTTPTDITIDGLTVKATPAAGDEVMIWDVAGTAIKKATVSSLAAASGVSSLNGQTGALVLFDRPQGRLTLSTGVPVVTATVSGATTVYYTPSVGTLVPIYDGTNVIPTVFAEISQLTTDATKSPAAATTNSNYDIFVWNDGGTIRATRGPAWTSNTARGTGAGTSELVLTNGIQLNKNAITNGPAASRGTYVGTIRTNGTSTVDYIVGGSASGGTAASLCVWNMYNRNLSTGQSVDTGASYTYTTGTIRQARASAGNQVSAIFGLAVDTINVSYQTRIDTTATSAAFGQIGIGEDITSGFISPRVFTRSVAAVIMIGSPYTTIIKVPPLGYHTYSANEAGDAANANTFNTDSNGTLTLQVWN